MRLVLVNRRDYPGSSPYTSEDLHLVRLTTADDTKAADNHDTFYRARAAELAAFMCELVKKEGLPKMTADGKEGGIALLAWSAGNVYTIPLLAYVDGLDEETRATLDPYLRAFVLFGTRSDLQKRNS